VQQEKGGLGLYDLAKVLMSPLFFSAKVLMSPLFFSFSLPIKKKMFRADVRTWHYRLMLKLKSLNMWQQPATASK